MLTLKDIKIGDRVKSLNPDLKHIHDKIYIVDYIWKYKKRIEVHEVGGKGWFIDDIWLFKKIGGENG